jgi:hypothetical protein
MVTSPFRFRGTEFIPFCLLLCLAGCGGSSGEAVAVKHAQDAARQQHDAAEVASILHEEDAPRTILMKVQAAHGGDRLAQWKAGYLKYRIEGQPLNPAAEVLVDETYELPDRLRRETSMPSARKKESTVFLKEGKQRKLFRRGEATPQPAQPAETQEERPLTIVFLLDMLQGPQTKLEKEGERYVRGQPTLALRGQRVDGPVFTVYFDKATALLMKDDQSVASTKARQATILETYYSDYQERGGIKLPLRTTVMLEGQVIIEASLLEAKPLGKVDRSVFEKP